MTITITLTEEQARILSEVLKTGVASSPEDALEQGLRALHSLSTAGRPVHQQVDNLADLFARSPFRGLDLDFERDSDTGRDITL